MTQSAPPVRGIVIAAAKSAVLGGAFLVAATLAADAQPAYPAYYYPPVVPYFPVPPPAPPSWNYDPYTSGMAPCPQWLPGDLPCREQMPPTFGQPNYRPVR